MPKFAFRRFKPVPEGRSFDDPLAIVVVGHLDAKPADDTPIRRGGK